MTVETPASSQRFLDAALDLFVEHGYNGTSLQMIGDRLGVSKAALTYHFKVKADLLHALATPLFDDFEQLLDRVEAIPREAPRRQQGLFAYIDLVVQRRHLASWLFRDVGVNDDSVFAERAHRLTARFERLLVADLGDPVTELWAAAMINAVTGPVLRDIDLPDRVVREQLEIIANSLLRTYRRKQKSIHDP